MDKNRCPKCGRNNSVRASVCVNCKAALKRSVPSSRTGLLAPKHMLAQRYSIIHRVGKGGFGAVYKAADTWLGNRLVAIIELGQTMLVFLLS